MAKKLLPEKEKLINNLELIKYDPEKESDSQIFEELSLARSLLNLADINHANEYQLCRQIAERLLVEIPSAD